ncbi:PilZ domain-containing protein [Pseudomonas sp. Marseille-QA0892]
MDHERRKHPRYSAETLLEAWDVESNERVGRVVDLSEGGAMLYCLCLPSEGVVRTYRIAAGPDSKATSVVLTLDCLWTRPASHGEGGWAGFQVVALEDTNALLELLTTLSLLEPPG